MKNKLIVILSIMIAILSTSNCTKAMEDVSFLITDDYVIIEHVKYAIIDNKFNYNGLEYEKVEDNLYVAYDEKGIPNIISLPTEEYRITDEKVIEELNNSVGITDEVTRLIPSSTVNLPYTKTSDSWLVTTPAVNVNVPGGNFYRVLSLKITGLAWNASKIFDVHGIYGDVLGNWYDLPTFKNHNFGTSNTVKWLNYSSTRYAKLIFGNLANENGFTYTVNRSTF